MKRRAGGVVGPSAGFPKRHTAREWRAVVARMQENMQWMNRVVGSKPVPGEPQLRTEEIVAFLEKYARR